jgi:plastocyanin
MRWDKRRHSMWIVGALAAAGGALACGDKATILGPAQVAPDAYWALTLDHKEIALSLDQASPVHNTLQLVATPRTIDGTAIATLGAPTFRLSTASDTTKVQVTPNGLVTARAVTPSTPVQILVSLQDPQLGMTLVDTAFVRVTAAARPLKTFTMQPPPGDSALVAVGWDKNIAARATDSADASIPATELRVRYRSSNPPVAEIDPLTGVIEPRNPGTVTFTATTIAYGVAKTDQVTYTVTMPPQVFNVYIKVAPTVTQTGVVNTLFFDPATITIKAGQGITWRPVSTPFVGITFDPAMVANVQPGPGGALGAGGATGGNISSFSAGRRTRLFPVPGTYTYTVTGSAGSKGTIIVTP